MKKGSPEGYNAETGFREPAQKFKSGEPNDYQTLYRIRCSQEDYQLLREGRRRKHPRRRHTACHTNGAAGVGRETPGAMARRDGGDAVQRLGIRCTEAVCQCAGDRQSVDDESHQRSQEEKRQAGCAENRRPGALQSASSLLCGAARDARIETAVALPERGSGAGGADEEQDEWAADGSGGGVQQTAAAQQEIFQRVAGSVGGSAGIGERFAATEPGLGGDVRNHAAAIAQPIAKRPPPGETSATAAQHRRSGRGNGADLGAGNMRPTAVPLHSRCGELLRAEFGAGVLGGQAAKGADFQTAQCALANRADRGGEVGAAVEPAIGGAPRTRTEARQSQSGDSGGGAETGGVSVGGGQIRTSVSGTQPATRGTGGRQGGLTQGSKLTSGKGDFPTKAARRHGPDARTVLAVKGSLRRAKTGRALDRSGPFRRKPRRDGRLRRENHHTLAVCSNATIGQRSTGRSSCLWGCTTKCFPLVSIDITEILPSEVGWMVVSIGRLCSRSRLAPLGMAGNFGRHLFAQTLALLPGADVSPRIESALDILSLPLLITPSMSIDFKY